MDTCDVMDVSKGDIHVTGDGQSNYVMTYILRVTSFNMTYKYDVFITVTYLL